MLRSQLIAAKTIGTAITRYVLKFSAIEAANVDDLVLCRGRAVESRLEAKRQDDLAGRARPGTALSVHPGS